MPGRHVILLCLAALAAPCPVLAASFDCASARAPAEKLVCGDAALSALDEQLARAYADAAATVPRQDMLRREQRAWITAKHDKAHDAAAMREAYQKRIAELNEATEAARALRVEVDPDTLKKRCVPLRNEADEICKVDQVGPIASASHPGLLAQVQTYWIDDLRSAAGVVVLQRQPSGKLLPLLWDATEQAVYDAPDIMNSPSGVLLRLPGYMEGTGNFNIESLYHDVNGTWQAIDIEAWQSDLVARLPKGRAVWKGMYPDWEKMTVETPLWRNGDPNCCPTGGSAAATLALRGERIVLTGLRVSNRPLP